MTNTRKSNKICGKMGDFPQLSFPPFIYNQIGQQLNRFMSLKNRQGVLNFEINTKKV